MRIFSERVVGVGEAGVAARVPAAPRARAVFGPVLFQQVGQSLLTQVGVLLTSGAPRLPIDERPAVARRFLRVVDGRHTGPSKRALCWRTRRRAFRLSVASRTCPQQRGRLRICRSRCTGRDHSARRRRACRKICGRRSPRACACRLRIVLCRGSHSRRVGLLQASIRLALTVCDAAGQHTREGWDAKKAEQAPSTLPLPQRSNPVTVSPVKVIEFN